MAVAIGLLIMSLAVPSVRGVLQEQALKESFERFDELARKAQTLAVSERRPYVLIWEKDGIVLEPYAPTEEDMNKQPARLAFTEGEKIEIERPAAMDKKPSAEWVFWRSGICEPAIIHFDSPAHSWKVEYNALSGRGTFIDQVYK